MKEAFFVLEFTLKVLFTLVKTVTLDQTHTLEEIHTLEIMSLNYGPLYILISDFHVPF